MNKDKLLQQLRENECLDLIELYQSDTDQHFYSSVGALYDLREQHQLTARISRFKTEVENLTRDIDAEAITPEQFKQLTRTLDLNQRTQKVARYIQTQDNHMTFAKPVDLVMFGDSITEWGPWHDAISIPLANRGLGGDTTDGMLRRIEVTTVCQPKLVCVMAGINDLAQGYSVEEITQNYEQMLNFWQARDIDIWVQSTLYVGQRLSQLNPLVTELNSNLQRLCQEKQLRFIDVNRILCPDGGLPLQCSADDLHLNAFAYGQWIAHLHHLFVEYF